MQLLSDSSSKESLPAPDLATEEVSQISMEVEASSRKRRASDLESEEGDTGESDSPPTKLKRASAMQPVHRGALQQLQIKTKTKGKSKEKGFSTGRWTEEEHALFLEGLKRFPYRAWKKIATLIETRTVVQIRTHAQKYYQKLAKEQAQRQAQGVIDQRASPSPAESTFQGSETAKGADAVSSNEVDVAGQAILRGNEQYSTRRRNLPALAGKESSQGPALRFSTRLRAAAAAASAEQKANTSPPTEAFPKVPSITIDTRMEKGFDEGSPTGVQDFFLSFSDTARPEEDSSLPEVFEDFQDPLDWLDTVSRASCTSTTLSASPVEAEAETDANDSAFCDSSSSPSSPMSSQFVCSPVPESPLCSDFFPALQFDALPDIEPLVAQDFSGFADTFPAEALFH